MSSSSFTDCIALIPTEGLLLGSNRLQEYLGEGAQGQVWSAYDQQRERQVAVKIFTQVLRDGEFYNLEERIKEQYERVDRIYKLASHIEHPNLVKILDRGRTGDFVWLSQELVPRVPSILQVGSLIKLERDRPGQGLTLERAVEIVLDAAHGLAILHANRIVHRDIKPSNILLTEAGLAKICDFDLAAPLNFETRLVHSRTHGFVGTAPYASQEALLEQHARIGPWSDVYSLGVVLYELTALVLPDRKIGAAATANRRLWERPTPPHESLRAAHRQVPEALSRIIMCCLEPDPGFRYQSAAELADDLRRYQLKQEPMALGFDRLSALQRLLRGLPRRIMRSPALTATATVVLGGALWGSTTLVQEHERKEFEAEQRQLKFDAQVLLQQATNFERPLPVQLDPAQPAGLRNAIDLSVKCLQSLEAQAVESQALRDYMSDGTWMTSEGVEVWGLNRIENEMERTAIRFAAASGAARWDEVRQRLVSQYGSTFEGLVVDEGLLPLGQDPLSGLEEFLLLTTGEEPQRDPAGRLVCDVESGIVLVLLHGGTYERGRETVESMDDSAVPWQDLIPSGVSSQWEGWSTDADTEPTALVQVDAFLLAKWEVTQAQYRRIVGANPSIRPIGQKQHAHDKEFEALLPVIDGTFPVELVSWEEATRFCGFLGLELPSESLWEYAAHAGATDRWWRAKDPVLPEFYCNCMDISFAKAQPTKYLRSPRDSRDDRCPYHCSVNAAGYNSWGLAGMFGNVAELCQDHYNERAHAMSITQDPNREPSERRHFAKMRSIRGGSFKTPPRECSPEDRHYVLPNQMRDDLGFRPMRRLKLQEPG